MHQQTLDECATKADAIRYACQTLGRPSTAQVRDWLQEHGVTATRQHVSQVVNAWRAEWGLADTSGRLVPVTDTPPEDEPDTTPALTRKDASTPSSDTPLRPVKASTPSSDASTRHRKDASTPSSEASLHPTEVSTPAGDTPTGRRTAASTSLDRASTPQEDASLTAAGETSRVKDASLTGQGLDPGVLLSGQDVFVSAAHQFRPLPATSAAPTPAAGPVPRGRPEKDPQTWLFYLVALVALGVSADTSWRFFGDRLLITQTWERALLFLVMELALIACAWAMRCAVRRGDPPGHARLVAWGLTGFAAYAAFSLSGPWDGLARVGLGPVLSMVMLHMALGIELRHRRGPSSTLGSRIGRELRERFLSRLGLADDDRDAAARTRDRAARRVAYLATARWTLLRHTRLRRALHQAAVAHDPAQRDRMLADLAALQHVARLRKLDLPAPW